MPLYNFKERYSGNIISFVRPSVLLQMLQQLESSAAQFASKRPLLRMDRHVISQVLAIHKRFSAHGAHEIPLPHVALDVYIQAGFGRKPLAAQFAAVLPQSFVQLLVDEKRGALLESFATQVAHVRSLAGVYPPMVLHVPFIRKPPSANVARVLLDALVHEHHVLLQQRLGAELLTAQVARKRLLPRVYPIVLQKPALMVPQAIIFALVAFQVFLTVGEDVPLPERILLFRHPRSPTPMAPAFMSLEQRFGGERLGTNVARGRNGRAVRQLVSDKARSLVVRLPALGARERRRRAALFSGFLLNLLIDLLNLRRFAVAGLG